MKPCGVYFTDIGEVQSIELGVNASALAKSLLVEMLLAGFLRFLISLPFLAASSTEQHGTRALSL